MPCPPPLAVVFCRMWDFAWQVFPDGSCSLVKEESLFFAVNPSRWAASVSYCPAFLPH
ncbi:hypothetical protein [Microcystis aeruginosa]|uniref:hypothetical protein n=1 Tax=Microcystis aeruginosa TaxID=1126 RepID=UPI00147E50D5|nr:hypothetical protein [Microcystis aeruginosa]MCZ8050011.1 hypothetical protein [Microcystis sp. LE19-41.2A]